MLSKIIVVAAALLLTGCAAAPPSVSPSEPPPIFSSQDAAVAAAQVTLDRYLAAGNRMVQSGGTDLSGYEGVISDFQLADEQTDADDLRSAGERIEGEYAIASTRVVSYGPDDERTTLRIWTCIDITGIRVIAADGRDLTARNHRSSIPYEVELSAGREGRFIIEEVRDWDDVSGAVGERFCSQGSSLPG